MKSQKKLAVFVLAFVLTSFLGACGNNTSSEQSSEQTGTAEPYSVEQVVPVANVKSEGKELVGSWRDIDNYDNLVDITKTDKGFNYKDSDGIYPGTFINGTLKVKISGSETDTADVYIDSKTTHMICVYQGSLFEYKKK